MELTPEQKGVLELAGAGESVLMKAFAGTGKTFILRELAKRFQERAPNAKLLYLAFNKSVQLEAERLFPRNVRVMTAHALAFQTTGRKYRGRLASSFRLRTVLELLGLEGGDKWFEASIAKKVFLAYLHSADERVGLKHVSGEARVRLRAHLGKDAEDDGAAKAVSHAEALWELVTREGSKVAAPHDAYLKEFQLRKPKLARTYTDVLFDEAQDANPAMLDVVVNGGAVNWFVGDPHQQIYAFRGAENALEKVETERARKLTTSFRFGDAIAGQANRVLGQYKDESDAVQGALGDADEALVGKSQSKDGGGTVVARTNGRLFLRAYESEGSYGFVGGVERMGFEILKDAYRLSVGDRFHIKDPFIRDFADFAEMKTYAKQAEDVEVGALAYAIEKFGASLPRMVDDVGNGAVHENAAETLFVTAHRSKGLEWETVSIEDDFLPWDYDPGEARVDPVITREEANVLYVAMTRAKRLLHVPATLDRAITSDAGVIKMLEEAERKKIEEEGP